MHDMLENYMHCDDSQQTRHNFSRIGLVPRYPNLVVVSGGTCPDCSKDDVLHGIKSIGRSRDVLLLQAKVADEHTFPLWNE
jgi:hypothetical protein